jgi:membrane protease YdiL (CAAX protease family)
VPPLLEIVLVGVVVATLAWEMFQGPVDFRRLVAAEDTAGRQAIYRKWTWQSLELYGLGSLLALWALGRLDALGTVPAEFAGALGGIAVSGEFMVGLLLAALATGLLLPLVLLFISARRARSHGDAPPKVIEVALGEFAALMPRNAAERRWALWVSINAGVVEELYFRLFVPLLLCAILGSANAAFVIAAVLFGLTHAYQGWVGVVASGAVGLVMTALYLGTGQLWVPIAVHAFIDINTLLLRPALLELARGQGASR